MDYSLIAAVAVLLLMELLYKIHDILDKMPSLFHSSNMITRSAKVFTTLLTLVFITRIIGLVILQILRRQEAANPPRIPKYFLYTRVSHCSSDIRSVCMICLAEGSNDSMLQCGHTFHWACIRPWLDKKNTCPICKTKQNRIELDRVGSVIRIVH